MNDQRIGNLTLPWRRRGAKHFTAPQYHHVHTLLKIFIITSLLVHSIATTDAFAKRQVNVLILRDVVITPIIVEVIEDAIDKIVVPAQKSVSFKPLSHYMQSRIIPLVGLPGLW